MNLGIDIGTSSVKTVLVDADGRQIAAAEHALEVSRPHDGWSEQDPAAWWEGVLATIDSLAAKHPAEIAAVEGLGLSGQMHGATLLGADDRVLRPCILWNDGRSGAECAALEAAVPDLPAITGNRAMPGFTAPKLAWVRTHEPDIFAATRTVLLPKDYVRLLLTGEKVSEPSDAAGTLWLDTGARRWSETMLAATGLGLEAMPRLVEGSEPSGALREELRQRWNMTKAPIVAGGAGDNAAGAIGIGAIGTGDAFVSLGTSGVLWVTTDAFRPNPSRGVHAFCHAIPKTWHQMGVILSAASALTWVTKLVGAESEAALVARIDPALRGANPVMFEPYLSGERTPHNDPEARAAFIGLSHASGPADLALAVLEGVAFAFKDCLDALAEAGSRPTAVAAIGGGSRSTLWLEIIAAVLDLPVQRLAGGDLGGAYGAARLGRLAATGEAPSAVATKPPIAETIDPDRALAARYGHAFTTYRKIYPNLKDIRS
ncbi:xylulokinase [Segnochrobactrum spirostomi]|uniref:Xylulose kinase n=1 Tax=Segnochrobactrum spirostomi TaxID=2608987 RepID=A0A6A7Y137_9HYPH|nr:xylulokinase [Segnochrobactrum spirostomi]MQT11811.1 xylulokinase [Segnochrobactrum spirostomi]